MQMHEYGTRAQWKAYCDTYGNCTRDPSKHNDGFLRLFIDQFRSGVRMDEKPLATVPPTATKDDLVKKVKEMQTIDQDARAQWRAYCNNYGNCIRDPINHNSDFLKEFIFSFNSGIRLEDSRPNTNQGLPPKSSPDVIALIKEMQKSDPEAKNQWWLYCDEYGESIRDPARHDDKFIGGFVEMFTSGGRVEEKPTAGWAAAGSKGWGKAQPAGQPQYDEQTGEFLGKGKGKGKAKGKTEGAAPLKTMSEIIAQSTSAVAGWQTEARSTPY